MSLSRLVVAVIFNALVLNAGTTLGQDFPSKPIRIVTTAAGGGSDFVTRMIAQGISGPLGQPVIVDNRPTLAVGETAAKGSPDGYALAVSGAFLWIVPLLRKTPYDITDFAPISLISRQVFVLAVHPSLPTKSAKELITLAKARPGQLNYSTGVPGAPIHLAVELFKQMAGVNIVAIFYNNTPPAITALVSGETQLTINDAGLLAPHIKSGKMKALAVTSAEPSLRVPGVPTVAASGLPGYEVTGMTGMWAPAKTPAPIINRLNQEVVRTLNRPDVKERFLNAGEEIVASSPEQFANAVKADIGRMGKVIKDAGIKLD